MVGILSLVF